MESNHLVYSALISFPFHHNTEISEDFCIMQVKGFWKDW